MRLSVLMENGQIIKGANQENAAYTMCLCAERVALSTASSNFPDMPIVAMAITVKSKKRVIDQPAFPCGACRQVISETIDRQNSPIQVVLFGEAGPFWIFDDGKDLIPWSFTGKALS